MTIATRGRIPLIRTFSKGRRTARTGSLLTASIAFGLLSLAGLFGTAVWVVATR